MPRYALDPGAVGDYFGDNFITEDDLIGLLGGDGGGDLNNLLDILLSGDAAPPILSDDQVPYDPVSTSQTPGLLPTDVAPGVPSGLVGDAPPIAFDGNGDVALPPSLNPNGTTVTTTNPPDSNPIDRPANLNFDDDLPLGDPRNPFGRPGGVGTGGIGGVIGGLGGDGTSDGGGTGFTNLQDIFNLILPNFPYLSGNKDALEKALLALSYQSGAQGVAQQKALFDAMFPALRNILTGEEGGFSKEALAAMRGQAIEGTARQFGEAQSGLKRALSRRGLYGGSTPVSGLAGRQFSELAQAGAGATSEALRNVTQANEQQRLQNLFNAFNIAAGFPSNPASSIAAGGQIAANQPGSFGKSILSSLAGAGIDALGGVLGDLLKKIGKKAPAPAPTGNPFGFNINFGFG